MASKRSRKVKKRQKALQRQRQRTTSKRCPLTRIPPQSVDQLAVTTTGEIMQLIRLHYAVQDGEALRAIFAQLRCMEYDASQRRWVWLYKDEAKRLPFKDRRAADHVVLGEFVFKGTEEAVLNLRSFERATNAFDFFDQHVPRTVARVSAATVSNRLLSVAAASSLTSLNPYFERAEVDVKDPESLLQTMEDMASHISDEQERLAAVMQYMDDRAKQPVPAMERFPIDYEDYDAGGRRAVEVLLAPHKVIAMQHWRGNTSYTYHDFVHEMFQHRRRGILSRFILIGYRIVGFLRRLCFGGPKKVYVLTKARTETIAPSAGTRQI